MTESVDQLQATGNNIIFKFSQDIAYGQHVEQTQWGFRYQVSKNNTEQPPRWGTVLSVGPDVNERLPTEKHITSGKYILIEPLMWSEGIEFGDTKIWYTSLEKVLLVSDTLPSE